MPAGRRLTQAPTAASIRGHGSGLKSGAIYESLRLHRLPPRRRHTPVTIPKDMAGVEWARFGTAQEVTQPRFVPPLGKGRGERARCGFLCGLGPALFAGPLGDIAVRWTRLPTQYVRLPGGDPPQTFAHDKPPVNSSPNAASVPHAKTSKDDARWPRRAHEVLSICALCVALHPHLLLALSRPRSDC